MYAKTTLATLCLLLAVPATVPFAVADDEGWVLSVTPDGECILVNWNASPPAYVPASGCEGGQYPCVDIDLTTTPPTITPSTNCT